MGLPGVVLAAGRSTRMGRPKALLELPGGESFCVHIVDALLHAGVAPVVIVTRAGDAALRKTIARLSTDDVRVVINPDPDRGQLSSLQRGLTALDPAAPAAVVTLVDVPLVSPASIRRIVDAWTSSRAPVVRPERGGRHGHPIVVSRAVVAALCAAAPTGSARDVIAPFLPSSLDVALEDEGLFADVDTPEEYARLLGRRRDHPTS